MPKYTTYLDSDGDEHEFTVFIIHGRSEDWRKVERFIKDDLDYDAIVIKEVYTGDVLNKKVRRAIEASDCAVAIMSPMTGWRMGRPVHDRTSFLRSVNVGLCSASYIRGPACMALFC